MKLLLRGSPQEIADFFKSFSDPSVIQQTTATSPVMPESEPNDFTVVADGEEPPQTGKTKKKSPVATPTPPARKRVGFVAQGAPEIESKVEDADLPEGDDIDRKIMNYLVSNQRSDIEAISAGVGIHHSDLHHRLARMEKALWVKSSLDGEQMLFATLPIRRKFQRPPVGISRTEAIEKLINEYPGMTTRDMGARLLLSTEDTCGAAGAKGNVGKRWTRKGDGSPDNPFRYYPIEQAEAAAEAEAEGQPS